MLLTPDALYPLIHFFRDVHCGDGQIHGRLGAFLNHVGQPPPSDALYLIMIGGNDVRTAAHAGNPAGVIAGVNAELAMIQLLLSKGATQR